MTALLAPDFPLLLTGRTPERGNELAGRHGASVRRWDLLDPTPFDASVRAVVSTVNDPHDRVLSAAVEAGIPYVDITRWTTRVARAATLAGQKSPSAPVYLSSGWMGGVTNIVAAALAEELWRRRREYLPELTSIEEAVAVRDRLIDNFAKAANLPAGKERDRLLTVTVVGGGFAGIETFAELRSLASGLLKQYPELTIEDTKFHLIEAMGRIMPEVSLETSKWVLKNLAERSATVHLDTQLLSAVGGKIELSTGVKFESDLIVWTAGVMANPVVRATDFPIEERGRIRSSATLQITDDKGKVIKGAWAAGDNSAVPDLTGGGVGGMCVPNAQHAVRQAKLMAKNIVAVLRGEEPRQYIHKNLGAVAGLGIGHGVFQSGKLAVKGFIAWGMHRGYHGLAMPMWERKFRVFGDWVLQFLVGRDTTSIALRETPNAYFQAFASRPAPKK